MRSPRFSLEVWGVGLWTSGFGGKVETRALSLSPEVPVSVLATFPADCSSCTGRRQAARERLKVEGS